MDAPLLSPRSRSFFSKGRRVSTPSIRSFQSGVSRASVISDTNHKQYSRPQQWVPTFLRPRVVSGILILTLVYAAVIQFALQWTTKHPWRINDSQMGLFSGYINFLKSALASAAMMPLVMLYDSMHQSILQLQAYVVLSKGQGKARDTILLNYRQGRFATIRTAIRNKHWIILLSSILSMICLILPPMGSGLLNSKPRKFRSNFAVTNKKKLELNVDNLEHFVAAAGYAQAATYHNLTDPPFVYGGRWAVAEFVVPPQSGIRNQLVVVPTVAIFTECHCGQGTAELTSASLQEGGPMLTGKWNDCQISIPIDDVGRDQFNVTTITDCPTSANLGPWNQPVAFTFYSSEVKKAATVFCWPQISLYNVKAEVNISTGALQQIYTVDQNVAGREAFERMSGRGHNGLSFDIPLNDTKAQAKAYAITSGLPAAIYEVAKRRRNIATVVQDMNGFWSLTKEAYTRYLAIVAKYAYFVDDNSMIQGEIETYETTIFVYSYAGYGLTGALLLIVILGSIIHYLHTKARKDVYIASNPDTIAATISMSSHSNFTGLIDAADTDTAIAEKLKGMRFGISQNTWQVAAYREDEHAFGVIGDTSGDIAGSPLPYGKEHFFRDPFERGETFDDSRKSLLSDTASTITCSDQDSISGNDSPPSR